MLIVDDRAKRVEISKRNYVPPFVLDPALCLYSPQDNVDALREPRISKWLEFVSHHYQPALPAASRAVLVFMPCTKTKPYPCSVEHQRINQRLLDEGFRPQGAVRLPQETHVSLEKGVSPEVLHLGPLLGPGGVVVHRIVISEPLGIVPYEVIPQYEGGVSPAVQYDDPGLFEHRGNAVSPWRPDSTARRLSATKWRWGDAELAGYVTMHNAMSGVIARAMTRFGSLYQRRIAWVSPGLTHRSFVLAEAERAAHGVPHFRTAGGERLRLAGANDVLATANRIEVLPRPEHCKLARERLAARLESTPRRVSAIYSRGGGGATPLALPEMLDTLVAAIHAP